MLECKTIYEDKKELNMSNQALITGHFSSPIGSLDAYIAMVNRVPMLTPEEEQTYTLAFHEHQDVEAAKKLVMSHLRFVVKIARGYDGYGLQQADLIQEGNIGLMKAVKRFNPHMGVRLVSFAVHWIKAEMHEFILRNWRIVKVATTKAQRKLFFNLRKAKKSLKWLTQKEMASIATDLNVPVEDVKEMEMRLHAEDADIHFHLDDDAEGNKSPFALHYLAEPNSNPAEQFEQQEQGQQSLHNLRKALTQLDARSQTIVQHRWLNTQKSTLDELAQRFGISCERVRQLEKAALQKLNKYLMVANA